MPISLSSCWCSQRHDDGYEMLREMVDLGFEYVELSHGIRLSLVPGILKAFDEGWVKASSIHNFCPLPPGVTRPAPNVFQPSGPSKVEMSMWMRHSLNTLQFANRIAAKRVVVHSGSTWFFWGNPTLKFQQYEEGLEEKEHLGDDAQFVKLRDRALKRMNGPARKGMVRVQDSIKALIPAAREMGVILGLENREGFTELPLDKGWNAYLDGVGDVPEARYWHDAGHAQIKHQLGLLDHLPHLESLHQRLTGWHLHDVSKGGKDHQTIGSGVIDWDGVKKFFKPDQAFVLELSPKLTREQVLESNRVVEGLLADQGIEP